MGTAYRYLGLATMVAGRCVEAQDYFQKSLEIFGEYYKGWDIARSLTYLGDAKIKMGDLKEAEKTYLNALHVAVDEKSIPVALDAVVGLAQLSFQCGEAEKAFELAQFVLSQAPIAQETYEISRQISENVGKHLGDDPKKWRGERLSDQSLETIVAFYLE